MHKAVDPDCNDNNNRTPLSWAAASGNRTAVEVLLEHGADPDSHDKSNRTPLSWAAGDGNEEIVEVLLSKNAELYSLDDNNRTPLSWAAETGQLAVVRSLLLKQEASNFTTRTGQKLMDLQAKDTKWTALWYAAMGGHVRVTRAILEDGADSSTQDKYGKTLMQRLVADKKSHNNEVREVLEPYCSLSFQCDPNTQEVDALFSAVVLEFPEKFDRELIHKEVNVRKFLTCAEYTAPNPDARLKWLHLPSNNVSYIIFLMKTPSTNEQFLDEMG